MGIFSVPSISSLPFKLKISQKIIILMPLKVIKYHQTYAVFILQSKKKKPLPLIQDADAIFETRKIISCSIFFFIFFIKLRQSNMEN